MDEMRQRMLLTTQQRHAVIHLDDHGVRDQAPLFVMDFETWQMYRPENFFDYFADDSSIAAYSRFKPAWQRYVLLYPTETKVLQGIYDRLEGDASTILDNENLSRRYYEAYVRISALVDELDVLVDRDLRSWGQWNHGYVLNDQIKV